MSQRRNVENDLKELLEVGDIPVQSLDGEIKGEIRISVPIISDSLLDMAKDVGKYFQPGWSIFDVEKIVGGSVLSNFKHVEYTLHRVGEFDLEQRLDCPTSAVFKAWCWCPRIQMRNECVPKKVLDTTDPTADLWETATEDEFQ
jgi:hypothetical protein